MFSPRFSSDGTYSTISGMSENTFKRHGFGEFSSGSELSLSAQLLAKAKVHEFLHELPMRSWLGKHISDRISEESGLDRESYVLADRLWRMLIRLDECQRTLKYALLQTGGKATELIKYDEVLERCWEKCRLLLELSAGSLLEMNPAYSRSSKFSLKNFIGLTISHSFLDTHLRYKWVRLANLICFTTTQAAPLLESLKKCILNPS